MASIVSSGAPLQSAIWLLARTLILYRICLVFYRVYLDPLFKFPGPRLYAASYLPYLYQDKIKGSFVKGVIKLHEKYGPIVRISPNRLSIDGSIGWPEIFARRPNQPEFEKTVAFYGLKERVGLITASREDHRRQRRIMAHAFSETALSEQEIYIKHYIDLLMRRLQECMKAGQPVDMTRWYNYLTFDIIGELAFADPFNCLEKSDYHPWVSMIFSSIRAQATVFFLRQYPLLSPLQYFTTGNKDIMNRLEHEQLARVKTQKRIAQGPSTRKDFMAYILRNNSEGKGMTHEEIITNARTLIVAGSETTATALAGLTFVLAQNLEAYGRLANEIRTAFSSEDEIDMRSTAALQYLHACLEEILRIYPPAGETPPRISPGDVVNGHYIPKGTYVSIYQWATHRSPHNFTDPDLFVPQRWLPATHPFYETRYASDNKKAFKPFAAGPRDCIGKNLAYTEMRLVVARMFWNFDVELLPGQLDWLDSQRSYTTHEKGPLMIRLKLRLGL